VGLILLAHSDVRLQEQVLAGPLRRYTEKTVDSPRVLRRILADVRRDGHVVARAQLAMTSNSVAAPVRGPDDSVVAALSIVVSFDGTDAHSLVPAVCTAARGISRVLGAPSARHGSSVAAG
ncbi:MAG: IclR family transcriptional regulator domain-containing protein, partial [Sciscionella sp.]